MKLPGRIQTASILAILVLLIAFFCLDLKFGRVRDADAYFRQGLIDILDGRLANANLEMDEAIRLSPNNAYYHACKGLVLQRIAEKEGGGKLLNKFLNNGVLVSNTAIRRVNEAIRCYKAALSLNPHDGLFHHNLGWLYWIKGDRPGAIARLQQAVNSGEKDAVYYISLGLMQDKCGEFGHAIDSYQAALQLSPKILDSKFFADLAKNNSGKADIVLKKAVSGLEEEMRQNPNPIVLARLGRLYLLKNRESAFAALSQSLAMLPNMSMAWFNLGVWHERDSNWDQMLKCFEKASSLERTESVVFAKFGKTYELLGRTREAIAQYEKAIAAELSARSEHSKIVLNLYHAKSAEPNDTVPKDLLSYCSSTIDALNICRTISSFYAQAGNRSRSQYYRGLWNRWALDMELGKMR